MASPTNNQNQSTRWKATLQSFLFSSLCIALAACSNSDISGTNETNGTQASATHLAALGPLSGATVTVAPVDQRLQILETTVTDAKGNFKLKVAPEFEDRLLLVTVSGGVDTDANDDGVPDAIPTPNQGSVLALVKGKRLNEKGISVTVLTDAIARQLEIPLTYLPPETINSAIENLSYQLMKGDIDGDQRISYDDVLLFTPALSEHQAKLDFDYKKAVLTEQKSSAGTLVSKYHTGSALLVKALEEAFSNRMSLALPTQEQMKVFSVTIRSGAGGVVNGQGFTLGAGNEEVSLSMPAASLSFLIKAVPENEFVFSRWIGCEKPLGADGCEVSNPKDNKLISAQFALKENKLTAGIEGELNLQDPSFGQVGIVFEGKDEVVVTSRANSSIIPKLKFAKVNSVFHTGISGKPQIKLRKQVSEGFIGTGRFYQARFQYETIALFDMYQQASFEEADRPMVLDDIKALTYATAVPEAKRTIKLPTTAGRDFVEGPKPTPAEIGNNACPAGSELQFGYQLGRPDDVIEFCIDQGVETLPQGEICDETEWTAVIVDGRRYCLPESSNPFTQATAQKLAALKLQDKRKTMIGQTNKTLVAKLEAKKSYSAVSKRLAEAKAHGLLTASQRAKEVWLVGYGRAFDLGDGVFITNNPTKPGLLMLEAQGEPTKVAHLEKPALFESICRKNIRSPECAGLGEIRRAAFNLFPGSGLELELKGDKYPALIIRVAIQIEVDFQSNGNVKWIKPLRMEANTSGTLKVAPKIGLGVVYQGGIGGVLKKDGSRSKFDAGNGAVDIYQKIVSFDFAKKSGVGAMFRAELEFGAGIEIYGEVKLENTLTIPISVAWDGGMAAGWGCRNWYWYGGRDCPSDTHFDFKMVPSIYARYDLKGAASVVIEPYIQASMTNGVEGVGRALSGLSLRGFVQGEVIMESPLLSLSNIPADVSARNGKFACIDGNLTINGNAYYGARASYKFTTKDSFIGKFWDMERNVQLYEYKKRFYSWGWSEPREDKPFLPKSPSVMDRSKLNEPDQVPCSGPLDEAKLPDEIIFKAGTIELTSNSWRSTKNRRMTMQADGNFVVYNYDSGKEKESERIGAALRASGTSGDNYRLTFQSDGNLVVYDIRDNAKWSTGTHGNEGSRLVLQKDGNLVIYAADGRALWATGTNE